MSALDIPGWHDKALAKMEQDCVPQKHFHAAIEKSLVLRK